MSLKRGNDNSQLRPEEVEALNDSEDSVVGSFQRASADVLAGRRIVKTKRPSTGSSGTSLASLAPAGKPSPFASFTGLTGAANTAHKSMSAFGSLGTSRSDVSEHKKKVQKLNSSFLKWASKQIETKPLSIWKDGVKDYMKHLTSIQQKYPDACGDAEASAAGVLSNANGSFTGIGAFGSSQSQSQSQPNKPSSSTIADINSNASQSNRASKLPSFSFGSTSTSNTGASVAPAPVPSKGPVIPSFSFSGGQLSTTSPSSAVATTSLLKSDDASATKPFTFSFSSTSAASSSSGTADSSGSTIFGGLGSTGAASAGTSFGNGFSFPKSSTFGSSQQAPFGSTAPPAGSTSNLFSFSSAGGTGAAGSGAGSGAGGGVEDEGEGEPILEPERVLKNADDTDEILHEAACKLYGFNKEDNEWKDMGKGTFRLSKLQPAAAGEGAGSGGGGGGGVKQRMLVRNPIGKIIFNAAFYRGMKIERVKGGLRFSAVVAPEEKPSVSTGAAIEGGAATAPPKAELKGFMLKLKADEIERTAAKLEAAVAAVQ